MEADAGNAEADAEAEIIFWTYCSAATEKLISE